MIAFGKVLSEIRRTGNGRSRLGPAVGSDKTSFILHLKGVILSSQNSHITANDEKSQTFKAHFPLLHAAIS